MSLVPIEMSQECIVVVKCSIDVMFDRFRRLVSQEGSADSVLSTELPAGAVVEMSVWDPRCRTSFKPSLLSDDETKVEVKESRSSQVATPDIWGTRLGSMALSEKELSSRRHENRLSYIQLSDKTQDIGTENLKCSIMILKHDEWGYVF